MRQYTPEDIIRRVRDEDIQFIRMQSQTSSAS